MGRWGRELGISKSVVVMSLRLDGKLMGFIALLKINYNYLKDRVWVNMILGRGPRIMTSPVLSSTRNYYKDNPFYLWHYDMPGMVLSASMCREVAG